MTLRHILMNIIIEGLVVLKELIFNSFYFGNMCGLERTHDFTVDTVCRCGVPERTESTDLILPQ